ncbi:hypothetical protein JW756_05865 [Candidatus Woesearchaeota archaeon]|nr:hypothetical protein [Candidatus Woesearchaeota archaeon]
MSKILGKPKNKLKDFFDTSKKLIQPPKALPEIKSRPEPLEIAHSLPAKQPGPPPVPLPSQTAQIIREQGHEAQEAPRKEFKLPRIEHPAMRDTQQSQTTNFIQQVQPQQRTLRAHDDDLKRFEEAIQNINIDIIHNETPEETPINISRSGNAGAADSYYQPKGLGEGYFSEIEHYIRNKDVNEIIDDVLKKDFLTSMKDYHDTKAEGKPFYLHQQDLRNKLQNQMDNLRRLEEEWHILRSRIEDDEKKKHHIEQEIERESQYLKNIFRQVKINHLLEKEALKEHYFKLKNGQELKCLNDLRKALSYISDEEFSHHATPEKNDFATWTKEALQMPELAEKIRNAKSREELQEILKNPL